MRHLALPLCLSAASFLLTGCDALGIESSAQVAERKQAEAHAIGSACRHAIRSIEDCFKTNPKAGKAAVFAGWKEMDQYMRDNQIVGMPSSAVTEPSADADAQDGEADPAAEHGSGEKATAEKPATGKASAEKSSAEKAPTHKGAADTKTHKS
ncbi:hypothetical protein [Hydrogenophaga sp. MI9]|uniref:hypothetical protein n=1 Tax=Hydrogenophaga sp. MI9 TaxID=3453719 RepID=UPI003EEA2AC7